MMEHENDPDLPQTIDPLGIPKWERAGRLKRPRTLRSGRKTTKPKVMTEQEADFVRGYSWPAFVRGIPRTAGHETPYVIHPMAAGIVAWLYDEASKPGSPIDYVRESQFQPSVEKWATAEARRMRLEQEVAENGEFDGFGRPRPVIAVLSDWEKRASYHSERLGLDPRALAIIRRNLEALHRERDAEKTFSELQQRYAKRTAEVTPEMIDNDSDEENYEE